MKEDSGKVDATKAPRHKFAISIVKVGWRGAARSSNANSLDLKFEARKTRLVLIYD